MTSKPKSWRDCIAIHPAAELFPLMGEDELRELGEDIRKHGLCEGVALLDGELLDGRNRLDAMEMIGVKLVTGNGQPEWANIPFRNVKGADPVAFVLSKNILRRHLTAEQRRELVEKLIKAAPSKSDRQIADECKSNRNTVGRIRVQLEQAGDVARSATRTDRKGRKQAAHKPPTKAAVMAAADRAEVRLEESQQQKTPPPPPADVVEHYTAPIRAAIRKALEGMTRPDGLRLITALRNELRETETKYLDGEALVSSTSPMSKSPEFLRRNA